MTDATCCLSNVTGAKCPLPRTHLIGMLLQLCIIPFRNSKTQHPRTHGHTQARGMPRSQVSTYLCPRRLYGGRNTPVAQTQRTRKYIATRTHGNAQVHLEGFTQTPVHHVAIRAPVCTLLRLLHVHSVRTHGVWHGNYS
jgi:hypothetical protein